MAEQVYAVAFLPLEELVLAIRLMVEQAVRVEITQVVLFLPLLVAQVLKMAPVILNTPLVAVEEVATALTPAHPEDLVFMQVVVEELVHQSVLEGHHRLLQEVLALVTPPPAQVVAVPVI
jgi:hypothetical protein